MITGFYTFRGLGQASQPDQFFCEPDPQQPGEFVVCTGITYGGTDSTPGAAGSPGTPGTAATPGAAADSSGAAAGGATGSPYGGAGGSPTGTPGGAPGGGGLGTGQTCVSLLGNSPAATFICNNLLLLGAGFGVLLLVVSNKRGGRR